MKLLIVLALIGAVFAEDEVIEPVMVAEIPSPGMDVDPVMLSEQDVPEFVDFGMLFIPDAEAREMGLEEFPDVPPPVHFVNADGDIQTFVDDDFPAEEPAEENAEVAAGELDPVNVIDTANFEDNPNPFLYDVNDTPQEFPYEHLQNYEDPTWR